MFYSIIVFKKKLLIYICLHLFLIQKLSFLSVYFCFFIYSLSISVLIQLLHFLKFKRVFYIYKFVLANIHLDVNYLLLLNNKILFKEVQDNTFTRFHQELSSRSCLTEFIIWSSWTTYRHFEDIAFTKWAWNLFLDSV